VNLLIQPPDTSSLLDPSIILSTLLSDIRSLCSSLKVRDRPRFTAAQNNETTFDCRPSLDSDRDVYQRQCFLLFAINSPVATKLTSPTPLCIKHVVSPTTTLGEHYQPCNWCVDHIISRRRRCLHSLQKTNKQTTNSMEQRNS
jgi:hypothetical protein